MAEVWKAKIHGAQNFQRLVVVKRILPHLSSDPEFVRMFTTEAMLSARLAHPNIVQVFEFSEVEGEHYLAMEYVNGVNLGEVSKQFREVRLPVGMATHIVREVSLALAYAHALADEDGEPLRIIHRDVSPSNVMIGYDGSVKLLDFGVAKALAQSDELTRTGALKGKVGYMSPEAVDGEAELDGRTDVFAAGVILHELLTGKRLFKGHDDLKSIALVRACKVEPPSRGRAEVPAELDRIVAKALARERAARYQSADDLAADLTKVLHDLQWDSSRTAGFLKQHEVRPVNQPALREPSRDTPTAPPAEDSPETMKGTVVERPLRITGQETAAVRARRRWTIPLAAIALLAGGGLLLGLRAWRREPGPPVAAPRLIARPVEAAPRAVPSPAPEPPARAPMPPAVAPGEGPAPVAKPEPPAIEEKRRRRKGGRGAAGKPGPTSPEIDLKRGDLLKTF
jgi:serine/threonine protein kinase